MSTHEKLRAAGARLANCAYNLAHCARLNGDERRSLDEARRDWDAAIAAQPSPVVKQNLTTQPAAAQEAVAWRDDVGNLYPDKESVDKYLPLGRTVHALYAAPAPAAQEAVARKTMATCPRDGTVVLLHWGEDHVSPGWWDAPCAPVQNGDGTWPSDTGGFPWAFFDLRDGTAFVNHAVDTEYGPTHWSIYAAPVTAAPTLDDELAQDRMSELCKLESDVLDVLPSVYYMDPPDGGDVSLGEQVKRMAEDAASWRKHASTPAAPGIDLVPDILTDLSQVAGSWVVEAAGASADAQNECAIQMHEAIERWSNRLNLGDASPKGDDVPHRDLVPGVMRCAKCAFQLHRTNLYLGSGTTGPGDSKTEPCPNGCGPLWPVTWQTWATEGWQQAERYFEELRQLQDSPKGGSEAHSAPDAIDMDNRLRSYPWTYRNQPGNVGASVLGGCARRAQPGGDSIDHGLSLLRELHIQGLGIVRVPKLDVGTKASDAEVRP